MFGLYWYILEEGFDLDYGFGTSSTHLASLALVMGLAASVSLDMVATLGHNGFESIDLEDGER